MKEFGLNSLFEVLPRAKGGKRECKLVRCGKGELLDARGRLRKYVHLRNTSTRQTFAVCVPEGLRATLTCLHIAKVGPSLEVTLFPPKRKKGAISALFLECPSGEVLGWSQKLVYRVVQEGDAYGVATLITHDGRAV